MNNPRTEVAKSQIALTTPANTVTGTAGNYIKMVGVFTDSLLKNWEYDVDGTLTYIGDCKCKFLFNGVSDLKVDKSCQITYGLYLNGALVSGAETPHDFTAASKTENIAITRIVEFNKNDYVNVYIKSSVDTTTASIQTLFLTFWGEK